MNNDILCLEDLKSGLDEFEGIYSMLFECAASIVKQVDAEYDGGRAEFIYDVMHNCDYAWMAEPLAQIFKEFPEGVNMDAAFWPTL